jgi:hypothetical protein
MYSRSRVYKLQHDDGHFYIGSTCNELRVRLANHKHDSIKNPTQPVYRYIAGNWENVRIILVEDVNCNNKDELRRAENNHIQRELSNPLCLNVNKAWTGIVRDENYYKNWLAQNVDYHKNWAAENPNYMRDWRIKNAEKMRQYSAKYRLKKQSLRSSINAVPDKEGPAQGTQPPNPFTAFRNTGSAKEGGWRTEKGSESISTQKVNALPNFEASTHDAVCCGNH